MGRINIIVSPEVHDNLRRKIIGSGKTLQQWVIDLIAKNVAPATPKPVGGEEPQSDG